MLNVLKQLKNFINGLGAAFPGGEQMGKTQGVAQPPFGTHLQQLKG